MKKIFTIILVFMALALPMAAQDSDGKSKPKPVIISTHPINNEPNLTILRSPMRICVEAWYDATANTLSISW